MASPHLQHLHLRSLYLNTSSNDPAVKRLEPLAKDIASYDWSSASPEVIKSVEEEIRSTAEGMPLDQALAYLRKRLTSYGEENENFDSQAIIQFLNIGGGSGS